MHGAPSLAEMAYSEVERNRRYTADLQAWVAHLDKRVKALEAEFANLSARSAKPVQRSVSDEPTANESERK